MRRRMALLLALPLLALPAQAQTGGDWVPGQVAELQALDKVTAKVTTLSIPVGSKVWFGTLEITVDACHKRPPEETPESSAFLRIMDHRPQQDAVRVFSGWMFAV